MQISNLEIGAFRQTAHLIKVKGESFSSHFKFDSDLIAELWLDAHKLSDLHCKYHFELDFSHTNLSDVSSLHSFKEVLEAAHPDEHLIIRGLAFLKAITHLEPQTASSSDLKHSTRALLSYLEHERVFQKYFMVDRIR